MDCLKQKKKKEKGKQVLLREEEKCVERYFFKYAFPCAQMKLKLGSLTQEEYEELSRIFLEKNFPTKEVLQKSFGAAFRRIKKLADENGKEIWDSEIIEEYWTKNHNEIINDGDGMYGVASENFKDLCKIHEAEITEVNDDSLKVIYDNRQRIVSNFLVPEAKVGDKVRIHYAFAIEIV